MERQLLLAILLVYVFTARGYLEVSDTSFSLQTAESIVTRSKLDIAPGIDSFTTPNGRSYSKYGIGLALLYVPLVSAAHALSDLCRLPERALAGFLISFTNIPFAFLLLSTFARLLRRYGLDDNRRVLLIAALALGTLVWRYAVYDFSEEMQAALLLLAFERLTTHTTRAVWQAGATLGAVILLKVVYLAFIPLFGFYLFASSNRSTTRLAIRAIALVTPVVAASAVVAGFNFFRFGSIFESGYGSETTQFYFGQMRWTLPALIGSLDKGMLVFSPVLLVGVIGWPWFIRRQALDAALCGSIVLTNLGLAAAWHSWIGGWSWGPRLLVPTIALWLLPAAFWPGRETSPRRLAFVAMLTCISIIMQLPAILIRDQELHDIRYNMLVENERTKMLNEPAAAWVIFIHKLQGREEIYSPRDFGIPADRRLDLTPFATFHSFSIWPVQIAYRFHKPRIAWLALFGLFIAAVLLARVGVQIWQALRAGQPRQLVAQPGA